MKKVRLLENPSHQRQQSKSIPRAEILMFNNREAGFKKEIQSMLGRDLCIGKRDSQKTEQNPASQLQRFRSPERRGQDYLLSVGNLRLSTKLSENRRSPSSPKHSEPLKINLVNNYLFDASSRSGSRRKAETHTDFAKGLRNSSKASNQSRGSSITSEKGLYLHGKNNATPNTTVRHNLCKLG